MSILDTGNIRYPQPPYTECSARDRLALDALRHARNVCPDGCLEHIDAAMLEILREYEMTD